MEGLLQNVELDLKRFLKTVIFSVLILPCLIGRTLAENAKMVTPSYAFTTELSTVFQYSKNDLGSYNSTISCYKCGAYMHRDGDNFDKTFKNCKDLDISNAEIEECPSFVAGEFTNAQCAVSKQTVSHEVTSFSRGCFFLRPCLELTDCFKKDFSGACRNCCNETLCNNSAPIHSTWSMLTLSLLLRFCFR